MSKYRFRLQTLLRLREVQRDEKRNRLAEAFQAQAILSNQQQEVLGELHQLQQLQRESMSQAETNVSQLMEVGRYQLTLRSQQNTMEKQEKILATEVEKRRQDLVEADREVKVLEKLQHRQRLQHRQTQERKGVKMYDEIGQFSRHALSRHIDRSDGSGEP